MTGGRRGRRTVIEPGRIGIETRATTTWFPRSASVRLSMGEARGGALLEVGAPGRPSRRVLVPRKRWIRAALDGLLWETQPG